MRVLIVEDRPGDAAPAEAQLRAAGHQTLGCTDPVDGGRCRAVRPGGACPLDEAPVDAVVLAIGPGEALPPLGLMCAARRHVPALSLAGTAGDDVDLVAAVEQVALLAPPGHTDAAREAVRASLDRNRLTDVHFDVAVVRDQGRLQIRVTTTVPVAPAAIHAAAVRALAAVRKLDPTAPSIGVTVRSEHQP